jgi:hypothetical protein
VRKPRTEVGWGWEAIPYFTAVRHRLAAHIADYFFIFFFYIYTGIDARPGLGFYLL